MYMSEWIAVLSDYMDGVEVKGCTPSDVYRVQ